MFNNPLGAGGLPPFQPRANIIYPPSLANPNIISAPPVLTAPKLPSNMMPPPLYNMPPPMMMNPMMGPPQGIPPPMMMENQMKPPQFMMMGAPNFNFTMPGGPGFMGGPMPPMMPILSKSDTIKKVFVKNIPNDVPDEFMESILKECGMIVNWKRSKNEKDTPMPFGYCEFETVEGVLRSMRLLNGLKVVDKELQIKPSEKTEMFIKEWKELRKREWEINHRDDPNPNQEKKEFDIFLERDDGNAIENIKNLVEKLDIEKIRDEKEREEEKKEHPREREREGRKRQIRRDNDRKYREKLSDWLRREEDKEKDRKREKEKEKEREKEKYKLLERELIYDSEEEKKRKTLKYQKIYQERKKLRQRELEEDEIERKKELQALEKPPEPEIGLIDLPSPEKEPNEMDEEDDFQKKLQNSKFTLQNEGFINQNQGNSQYENSSISLDIRNIMNKQGINYGNQTQGNPFLIEEEDEDNIMNPGRKHKPLTKIPGDKSLAAKIEENEKIQKLTSQAILNNENIKKELENILAQIPKNKSDLFDYPINWTLFATSNLLDKKVKPWLINKSIEYIGTEEPLFVSMIYKKVANKESPHEIVKNVEKVLDEDAESFVMKLWRMIIFELLKAKSNL